MWTFLLFYLFFLKKTCSFEDTFISSIQKQCSNAYIFLYFWNSNNLEGTTIQKTPVLKQKGMLSVAVPGSSIDHSRQDKNYNVLSHLPYCTGNTVIQTKCGLFFIEAPKYWLWFSFWVI